MSSSFGLPRQLVIFGIIIPSAAFLGYAIAEPYSISTLLLVGFVLMTLSVPVLLKWHHPMLILSWNAGMNVFFLPGQMRIWMPLAAISFGISFLDRLMDPARKFVPAPGVKWTLLIFAGVVVITAWRAGGVGFNVLGSGSMGGKRYVEILLAIIGYLAITAQPIPREKAGKYAMLFFLTTLTLGMSNLIYFAGPAFYWLYAVFPVEYALSQAVADYSLSEVYRFAGLGMAVTGPVLWMLARYGVRGLLDITKPWRGLLLMALLGLGLVGGFRSLLAFVVLTFIIQFFLQGLYKTRLFLGLILVGVIFGAALIPLANKLPLPMQRSLSFLPLDVNPVARADALSSTQWRMQMWQMVLPELPNYKIFGKGYKINPTEAYLMSQAQMRGHMGGLELTILNGDYHSGPLSLYVTFGSLGTLAFIAFLIAGIRVLHCNYRYGDSELKLINTLFYSWFIAKIIFYIVVFGAINSDMMQFTGIVGMSVALNHGVRKAPRPEEVSSLAQPQPVAA